MSAAPHGAPKRVIVCVMAKSPLPGAAKSRLARGIGEERAARIARAMISDTWAWIATAAAIVEPVLVLQGPKRALPPLDPPPRIWRQRSGNLGSRLERALRRAARESGGGALAVGTDTVGLPPERLATATEEIGRGQSILGPTDDGGYYLMGIPAPPPAGMLARVRWSSEHTLDDTLRAFDAMGWTTSQLPHGFDIDERADLDRLAALLAHGAVHAPATRAALEE